MDEFIKENYKEILSDLQTKFERFAKLSEAALRSLEKDESSGDIERLVSQFDHSGSGIWNNMLRLMEQADDPDAEEDALLTSDSVKILIGKDYLCAKLPLLSTGNRKNRQRLYPAVLNRKLCEQIKYLPEFKDKVLIAVNVYGTKYNSLRIADPSNLDSKKAIDAVTSVIGGDGGSNTAAYISSCIVTDDIEEGCWILAIDAPSLRSRIIETLTKVLSKNDLKIL